jgi:hypothetical protein
VAIPNSDFETARKILIRMHADRITATSTEAEVHAVACEVLGADQDAAQDDIFRCLMVIHPLPKRRAKTPSKLFVSTGRPLVMDRMMRRMMDRAMVHPAQDGYGRSRGPRSDD